MMKRTGVPRLGPDEPLPMPSQNQPQIQQPGVSNMHTLAQSIQPQILGATTMLSVSGGGAFGRSAARSSPAVINYMKPQPTQYQPPKQPPPSQPQQQPQRHKLQPQPQPTVMQGPLMQGPPMQGPPMQGPPMQGPPMQGRPVSPPPAAPQFQRLKVEDALSYLDQVKYKFNTQPQVYNDFLDIMKEFKSQTIDTPGVITRVSNLFKGHPELIVGFNTFLPPGYKIEVQSNGQVSVSMPSPGGMGPGVLLGVHQPQLVHLLPAPQTVTSAIVHNLSVSAPPPPVQNTLHHISQAHQQIEAAAIHHANPGVQQSSGHNTPAPAGQPVEFNHAIEYVNKIKSRFSRQPDKYKRFLEILHAYQRGHRDVKEPHAKQQTEQEVYSQVAKLFENQDDLLAEFGQFLPDAKAVSKSPYPPALQPTQRVELPAETERVALAPAPAPPSPPPAPPAQHHHLLPQQQPARHVATPPGRHAATPPAPPPQQHHLKRSPSFSSNSQIASSGPAAKKARTSTAGAVPASLGLSLGPRDVSYAEAAKYATLHEYNFFDKARKAMKSQEVYDNFLRCLVLYSNEIISGSELVHVAAPFLCRAPELQAWLAQLLTQHQPTPGYTTNNSYNLGGGGGNSGLLNYARDRVNIDNKVRDDITSVRHDRDIAQDIDLSTCKRLGTSYCALPAAAAAARRCSGRTALCNEVLNDTWVSFPTWSEDSTFVTSRKTQYEEYIYRCEDERFELDVVIETNAATIRVLEGVQKKLSRMSAEEAAKHRLDECLGGHSATIHQRALRRIYGDKVAVDIIAGLKKNPVVAVPVVLRRLKAKEEEWREAQKGFNKQWREQNEKYYLKSLDHQGINFKQNDLKSMRSKSLFNEVESAYAARRPAPHLVVDYSVTSRQEAIKIVRDAAELLIHHARRQTTIQKAEKRRIKQLLRQFLPDLLKHPRQPLSDDERDLEEKEEPASPGSPTETAQDNDKSNSAAVKQEKQESSESDNSSDKSSSKHNKNDKENKPKNINSTDSKDMSCLPPNSVKRSSSNDDSVKSDLKSESNDIEDDYRDHPTNESWFVCTSSWYLFLRAHGTLCQRLAAARRSAVALAREQRRATTRAPTVAHALRLKPNNLPSGVSSPAEYYNLLLDLVKGVLDGNMDASAYEDAAREMLGIKAYPAYTIDKIVSIAVRQLQHCVSEPWSVRARELAARRTERGYVARAAAYLRQQHSAFLVKFYGGEECRVTYELLEGAGGAEGRNSPQHNNDTRLSPTAQGNNEASVVRRAASWSLYTERYSRPDLTSQHLLAGNKPVFLARNARKTGASERNTATERISTIRPHHSARKRQVVVVDRSEQSMGRQTAARAHCLYRAGALRDARRHLPAAQRRRATAFHAWLQRTHHSN